MRLQYQWSVGEIESISLRVSRWFNTKRQFTTQQMVYTVITRHAFFPYHPSPWKICVLIYLRISETVRLIPCSIFWVTRGALGIVWRTQCTLHHTVSPYSFPWKVCVFIHSWAGRTTLQSWNINWETYGSTIHGRSRHTVDHYKKVGTATCESIRKQFKHLDLHLANYLRKEAGSPDV